jgi:2-oxoglutarate ferredoxin oxidoreductase subunit alpha
MEGIRLARENGIKVGILRLVVVWPFPGWRIAELAGQIKAFVVPELNMGQMVLEVERYAAGQAKTLCVPHAGGTVHDPREIATVIEEAVK